METPGPCKLSSVTLEKKGNPFFGKTILVGQPPKKKGKRIGATQPLSKGNRFFVFGNLEGPGPFGLRQKAILKLVPWGNAQAARNNYLLHFRVFQLLGVRTTHRLFAGFTGKQSQSDPDCLTHLKGKSLCRLPSTKPLASIWLLIFKCNLSLLETCFFFQGTKKQMETWVPFMRYTP